MIRRWRALCAWALLATLCAACASGPSAAPQTLRIATWNIHHGRGGDGQVDLDRIAGVIRAFDADIVALQEVDVGVRRSGGLDIPAELAERLGMQARFGKNIDHQGGDYGNATLSRWPIVASRNHHYRMLREGEQRGALITQIAAPTGAVVVINTHIDFRPDDAERMANIAELEDIVDGIAASNPAFTPASGGPSLLLACGDFNDLPTSRVHRAASRTFHDAWIESGMPTADGASFSAAAPTKRIDWILRSTRSDRWIADSARVVHEAGQASDHLPVLATLQLWPLDCFAR